MENLARYIIRASFSQERMTYIPEESKVIYQSKDGKEEKTSLLRDITVQRIPQKVFNHNIM